MIMMSANCHTGVVMSVIVMVGGSNTVASDVLSVVSGIVGRLNVSVTAADVFRHVVGDGCLKVLNKILTKIPIDTRSNRIT